MDKTFGKKNYKNISKNKITDVCALGKVHLIKN